MNFEDLSFLFACNNTNRGIIRQNFDEAALLWRAVKKTKGNILEIGRMHGGSTCLLLAASSHAKREVTSIDKSPDHHPVATEFFNREDNKNRVKLLKRNSRAGLGKYECDLAFIDGDHSYEGVKADVLAHWPSIEIGGIIVFHDSVPNTGFAYAKKLNHCEGVNRLCNNLIATGCVKVLNKAGSMLEVQKLSQGPSPLIK